MDESGSAGNWLQADELTEALNSLQMVQACLPKVALDVYYWKWIIIALHNSLQSFMVCALRGSNGLSVLTDKCRDRWLHAYEGKSGKYPIERMDPFLNLYGKIKGDNMRMFVHSKQFVAEGEQDRSVDKLNEYRNEFIHFLPKSWSLEVSGLPQIAKDCVEVIRFLMFDSGNMMTEVEQRAEVDLAVENIENELSQLENTYSLPAN